MSTINHRLRPYQRKDGSHQIQVIYNHGSIEPSLYLSVGTYGCLPEHFDKEAGRVKKGDPHHEQKNVAIFNLERRLLSIVNKIMEENREPDPSRVKAFLDNKQKDGGFVRDGFDGYRDYLRDRNRAYSTISNVDAIEAVILGYEELHECSLQWQDINGIFSKQLVNDMMSGRLKNKRRLSDSTVKGYLGRLMSYMIWAKEAGYHKSNEFFTLQVEAKTIKNKPKEKPMLFPDEVDKLKALELTDEEDYQVRLALDKLLFGIETSLRISDIHGLPVKGDITGGLKRSDIKEIEMNGKNYKYVSIISQKSEKQTDILLSDYALELIDRQPHNAEKIFEFQSASYMSYMLREAGRRAGLDRVYRQTYKKGGRVQVKEGPIWKFLTSHVGRVTYGYHWKMNGGSLEGLRDTYGHTSIDTTQRHYERYDKLKALQEQLEVKS